MIPANPVSQTTTRHAPPAVAFAAALILAAVLGACATDPWLDSRREGGSVDTVGASTPDRAAICHASSADPAMLHRMAAEHCSQTGRTAQYVGTERFQCRLVTPHRSYFECR